MVTRSAIHRVLGALLRVIAVAALAPVVGLSGEGRPASAALVQNGGARTFSVAVDGSDDGDGSAESPWRTIQRAADAVRSGDTVLINPGTYEGGITVTTSGAADAPITFRAAGPDVVIDGSADERDAFFIDQADFVVVEGLTIRNATRAGLRVSASNRVTIRDSFFADNGNWGIFTDFSDDLLIEGNDVSGSREEHGIYVSNSGDRPIVRNNRVYNNVASGIQLNADVSIQEGPNPDGIISGALIEDNVVYLNGADGGAALNLDGVVESVIRNNLLFENTATGIALFQQDGAVCSRDNLVLNNTIVMAEESRWAILISAYTDPPDRCTGNRLLNNIVYADDPDRGSISIPTPDLAGFASDHNILVDRFSVDDEETFVAFDEWQALGFDTNSLLATPGELFVDAAGGDYHLRPGSPAIDAGADPPLDLPADLEGYDRPAGDRFDIGAFEFQGAAALVPDEDGEREDAAEAPEPDGDEEPTDDDTSQPSAPAGTPAGVQLVEIGGSGVSGLAIVSDVDGQTEVILLVQGATPDQIALVHRGSCADLDLDPAFLLASPDETGRSESILPISQEELFGIGYTVAIHAGVQDLATIVACGEFAPETVARMI